MKIIPNKPLKNWDKQTLVRVETAHSEYYALTDGINEVGNLRLIELGNGKVHFIGVDVPEIVNYPITLQND